MSRPYDDATVAKILMRILKVCNGSGHRKRGIFKAMDENRNLYSTLRLQSGFFDKYPWIDGCVEGHDLFFENLLAALRPTFPGVGKHAGDPSLWPQRWPGRDYSRHVERFQVKYPEDKGACLNRVLAACAEPREGLARRLDQNRRLLLALYTVRETFDQCPYVEGWIELLEIFVMDLLRALGDSLPDNSREQIVSIRPWPGRNYTAFLMVFEDRQETVASQQKHEDRLTEKLWLHEQEARESG